MIKKKIALFLCLTLMNICFVNVFAEYTTISDAKIALKAIIDDISATDVYDVADAQCIIDIKNAIEEANSVYIDSTAELDTINTAIESLTRTINEIEYISANSILTNNTLSDNDKATYYPSTAYLNTSISYEYNEESEFVELDSENNNLLNGLTGQYTSMLTSDAVPTVVLFDLSDEYYVTGVDIFSQFVYLTSNKATHFNIGKFDVEVSVDGNEYKKIASAKAQTEPKESEKNVLIQTVAKFGATLSRYVKITIYCDDNSSKYNFNEIVIKGFKYRSSRGELYEALATYSDVYESVYSPLSYNNYIEAYSNAQDIYWNASASDEDIVEAKTRLETAYSELENVAEIKIISGNVESNFTKEYYSDFKEDAVNIKYSYQEGSNAQIAEQDALCDRLLQGKCDLLNGTNMAYGTWDSSAPAKILFNLGEECYVSGVDVWEYYNAATVRSGNVKISVSDDGVNFVPVSEQMNPKSDDERETKNVISQDFTPRKCRYLLVVVEKGASHQIVLNEVVIRGYRVGNTDKTSFEMGILDYKDSNGKRTITLDGNSLNISGKVQSNENELKEIIVLSVAYDENNDMIDFDFTSISVPAYGEEEFNNILDLNGEINAQIHTYVWDSLQNGNALSHDKQFGKF